MATDAVLTDGSSTSLAKQAAAAGAKILMMTGSPDRIVEFDGAGQPYLSKPFSLDAFVQRVQEILEEGCVPSVQHNDRTPLSSQRSLALAAAMVCHWRFPNRVGAAAGEGDHVILAL